MQAVSKVFQYIKPYWLFAVIAPLMMILEVCMDLLQPTIMQQIIDNGIAKGDNPYIYKMFAVMIASAILGLIGGAGCTIFASRTAVNFSADLRQDLYEVITHFSSENKDKFTLGKLITNLTNDIEMLQRAVSMMLKIFVRGPMLFIGAVIIVYFTARELFPVLFVVVPILAFFMYFFTYISGKLFHKVQAAVDIVNTRTQESLAGIRVIKAYNRRQQQVAQFKGANDTLTKHSITADQVMGVLMPLTMFVVNMGIIAGVWMGAIRVEQGTLEVGVILAFINYLMIIMNGLSSSANVLVQIARAIPSAQRIVAVLEEPAAVQNVKEPITKPIKGNIEFRNVSFAYVKGSEPVLKDISFHVQAGQTVGIIGMTGSGKSTLVKVLPRLFDVDSGHVLMDGQPITQYDVRTLRQAIGFAPQKATLFSQTIRDNVKYGNDTASDKDLREALIRARALEFVEKLAEGVDYGVTQGATNLSGGQKQRLAMARAFIREPKILVLDDTTSAVDTISERAIQLAISEHFANSTKFIVSSKISSIKDADIILVMDDGQVVAQGTHEQLLATSGLYKEMADTQVEKGGVLHE